MPEPLYVASPSRLLAWLDCPRRYRMAYLDRPRPAARPQRAHTSVGLSTHNALRDWWDLPPPERTPTSAAAVLRRGWIDVGFGSPGQSDRWRGRVAAEVSSYLTSSGAGVDPRRQPIGVERTVSGVLTPAGALTPFVVTGRIDRLDERDGRLVVVDYKTSRRPPTAEDARTSLALAMYAILAARVLRRSCTTVELHHVPSGEVVAHEHTRESLERKVAEAASIAADARAADSWHRASIDAAAAPSRQRAPASDTEVVDARFPPRVTPLCRWCDYRAHCPDGQQAGPEQPSWAALEDSRD